MGGSFVRQNLSPNAGRRGRIVREVNAQTSRPGRSQTRLLSALADFGRLQSIAADFKLSEDQIPLGCVYFFVVWGSDVYLKGMKAQSAETCRTYAEALASAAEGKKSR